MKTQEAQRVAEIKALQAQLPKGLRGLLSRATGQYQKTLLRFKHETDVAQESDRAAQHALVIKHLSQRQALARDVQQHGLSSAFVTRAHSDPTQALVLRDDGLPFTKEQLLKSPERVLGHISEGGIIWTH